MANATRILIKLRDYKDPREELSIALSKLKRKIKETGLLTEYFDHQAFQRPAVRRKIKSQRALARRIAERKRSRKKNVHSSMSTM